MVNNKKTIDAEARINADVNLDGKIDKKDINLLNLYVANWKIELPYTKEKYGDVNLDGNINLRDVTLINQVVNNKKTIDAEARINADINLDGVVNSKDHSILKKYLAGAVTKLPIM